jgi:hypothetical protein
MSKKAKQSTADNAFQPIVTDPTSMIYSQWPITHPPGNSNHNVGSVEYVATNSRTNVLNGMSDAMMSSVSADLTRSSDQCLAQPPSSIRVETTSNRPATLIEGGEMTLSVSLNGLRGMVRGVVKTRLFPKVKFLIKEKHGMYAHRQETVCGMVMKHCNISAVDTTSEWWNELRPTIFRTHTDHRNNCIKAIRLRYRGNVAITVSLFVFLHLHLRIALQRLYRVSLI